MEEVKRNRKIVILVITAAALVFLLIGGFYVLLFWEQITTPYSSRHPSDEKRAEVREMFDSFPKTDGYAFLQYGGINLNGKILDVNDSVVSLDDNGFWSYRHFYTEDREPAISFYYTKYDGLEPELLGTAALPSICSTEVDFYGGNFYYSLQVREPNGEVVYYYYRWNVNDKEAVRTDDYRPVLKELKKEPFSFSFSSPNRLPTFSTSRWKEKVEVTETGTGITKTVGKKILKTFPEGEQIYSAGSSENALLARAHYISGDDIYFLFQFALGVPNNSVDYYHYIVKWNFRTEECTFVTTVNECFGVGAEELVVFD